MTEVYYAGAFALSVALMLIYVFLYHRHYDLHISLMFMLAPINNLGQLMLCRAQSLEAALLANRFIYISACYLILMITLAVFSLCNIQLNRYFRLLLYLITTVVFLFTQQIGRNPLYYKSVELITEDGASDLVKEYGPLHLVFYIMVSFYFALSIGALFYSFFRKKQVSNRFIALLTLPEIIAFLSFFGIRRMSQISPQLPPAEMIPLAYDLAMIVYLVITHKIVLYNIPDTVIDTFVQKGDTGFISFDFKFRYLGSNEKAKGIFPELKNLTVDSPITSEAFSDNIVKWLKLFYTDNKSDHFYYKSGKRTYLVTVGHLSDGRHNRGYQIFIADDTKNQEYISLLDSFNTQLKTEVAEKTAHIVEMHDNLILSMAVMVESRDNSTGGHIRRTSDCVRILIDELMRENEFGLSEAFCKNLIKAAPMHDLGKIAVDDAILRKPGRFTDAEFEIMKTHAAEGAQIVHEILKGTDDEAFRILAENVAHYHHERWDGSGYPNGLKGDEIPLEARIMAIADVYDALISKRVYKESMSFEKADQIITEGMGKHFDNRLAPYYKAARPKLEAYYRNLE